MTKDELIRKLEGEKGAFSGLREKYDGLGVEVKVTVNDLIDLLGYAIGLVEQLEPKTRSTTQTWDLP